MCVLRFEHEVWSVRMNTPGFLGQSRHWHEIFPFSSHLATLKYFSHVIIIDFDQWVSLILTLSTDLVSLPTAWSSSLSLIVSIAAESDLLAIMSKNFVNPHAAMTPSELCRGRATGAGGSADATRHGPGSKHVLNGNETKDCVSTVKDRTQTQMHFEWKLNEYLKREYLQQVVHSKTLRMCSYVHCTRMQQSPPTPEGVTIYVNKNNTVYRQKNKINSMLFFDITL